MTMSDSNPTFPVATYNIHRCIGRDGRRDPDRVAEVLRELNATIIGLQEVESYSNGRKEFHQLNYLAKETGLQAVAGPTVYHLDGHYGNSLLTSEPIHCVRHHDLSLSGREPRGALDVSIELHGSPIRVIITHLGLHPLERRHQIRRLLDILRSEDKKPAILMGDFNLWFPWSRALYWLRTHCGRPPCPPTFPSGFPFLALDRVWVLPPHEHTGTKAHVSPMARLASDHLPLKVKIKLNGINSALIGNTAS